VSSWVRATKVELLAPARYNPGIVTGRSGVPIA
jgi:hypothetical protein